MLQNCISRRWRILCDGMISKLPCFSTLTPAWKGEKSILVS